MTIYITSYDVNDLENPGISTDSDFKSLRDVIKQLGTPNYSSRNKGILVYGKGNDRVMFTNTPFNLGTL